MPTGHGKFVRQHNSKGYGARVEVDIEEYPPQPYVRVQTSGWESPRQGDVFDVPATGFDDWKQGAIEGVTYALKVGDQQHCGVTITHIVGLITDTNPTVVAAAAMDAVWKALSIEPPRDIMARVQDMVFQSWDIPSDSIPHFD